MEESSPPPVKRGDWILRDVIPSMCPWAIISAVYDPSLIEVMCFSGEKVIKVDWKWTGHTWGILADYGMELDDRSGQLRQRILDSPPADLPVICFGDTRPNTISVVWRAR